MRTCSGSGQGLSGKFKAWIYQFSILACLLCPLVVYDIPQTTVEGFEKKSSGFLTRYSGLLSASEVCWTSSKILRSHQKEFKSASNNERLSIVLWLNVFVCVCVASCGLLTGNQLQRSVKKKSPNNCRDVHYMSQTNGRIQRIFKDTRCSTTEQIKLYTLSPSSGEHIDR